MTFQQEAKQAIRASGGRITPQRELLLDLLAAAADDLDAETLHRLAAEQDASISLPTVYRTLNTLEAAAVIRARYVSRDHERKRYRARDSAADVFHLTCRNCGQVISLRSELIDQLKRELSDQSGAEITTLCLCAGGLCADCREEASSMTLDELVSGQAATVRKIGGQGALRRRLMDMGLVRGVTVEHVKAAPMGDPVEYLVRGYHLSLRKSEAALIEVEPC